MEELTQQWEKYIIKSIYKKFNKPVVIVKEYHCYQLNTKLYPTLFSQG
jgi:hypothetical protein